MVRCRETRRQQGRNLVATVVRLDHDVEVGKCVLSHRIEQVRFATLDIAHHQHSASGMTGEYVGACAARDHNAVRNAVQRGEFAAQGACRGIDVEGQILAAGSSRARPTA